MSTLAPGARLGPYAIRGPIGAGGMGEVFEATDTRLDRTVAIKVLASFWTGHQEMKERFDREAQTIASLNHPNICVLHDVGQHNGLDYLVMERLEGETLAARLERGPLSLEESLKIAVAIADALDKAHRRGVIHRDLKPSNVMLTATGPKLLDFGLAKFSTVPAQPGSSVVQTRADLSGPGTVLGTLQYMSPEQLEGGDADARTDIFAFGALVHEMITGKRAFEGRSRVLLISAIATSNPEPLSTFNADVPPALDHIIRTCLAKEPGDRWQTARDLLAELRWVLAGGADVGSPSLAAQHGWKRHVTRARVGAATAIIAAVGVSIPALLAVTSADSPAELRVRVPLQLTAQAEGLNIAGVANGALMRPASFALSADGRTLAFVARTATSEPFFLYVRPTGGVAPVRIAGTEDAAQPFWSPDGRSVAFVVGARLRKVDVSGGQPQEIGVVPDFFGGTWNADGVILFGSSQGVFRVRAEGGTPELIMKADKAVGGHFWPRFLPDGRRFVYTAWAGEPNQRAIHLATLGLAETSRVLPAQSNAGVTSTGYLVYSRGNIVYAQRFDEDGATVSGEPMRLADEVVYDTANGRSHFALSDTGALVYFYNRNLGAAGGGASSDLGEWQYSWVNRTGQILASVGPWGAYRGVDVSPDTTRVAVHRHDAKGGDIWILEPRGSETHLTFDTGRHNSMPIWSPDGTEIVYASQQKGKWGIYRTLSSGSGTEQLLYESELLKVPMSWRGSRIVFWVQDPKTGGDIWVYDLEAKKAAPFHATPSNETHAQISPDGKWIAFTSNQRDNRNEIYVRPFPTGTGLWQVTDAGGDWPRWKGNSREIYFHSIGNVQSPSTSFGNGAFPGPLSAIAVDVVGGVFQHDPPQQLLIFPAINVAHTGGEYHNYGVSPDGARFLVPQYVPSTGAGAGELGADLLSGLTIVVNWARR